MDPIGKQFFYSEDKYYRHQSFDSFKELQDLKYAIDRAAIVSISDPKGMITYVNDMALKIYGYSRDELIGKNHKVLSSGVHSKEFFRDLWRTILSGEAWRGEVCNKAKDGSMHWLDTTIVPFLENDGEPYQFMAIRKDITEKKRLEVSLEDERVRRSCIERLSAVGEMAANIAHEVKSPLTAIMLQTQILRQHGVASTLTPEIALGGAEKIERVARYLDKIVNGLLSLSRDAESDPMERASVKLLIDNALEFCSMSLEKRKITVFRDPAEEEFLLECRPTQISQVLLNLLNNSKDAIEKLEDRWIRIGVSASHGFVRITIADSGSGLTPKIRSRIMEPFFTTKKNGKGTGLGLSISRKIIDGHGGQLVLADTKNTCFLVKLPEAKRGLGFRKDQGNLMH